LLALLIASGAILQRTARAVVGFATRSGRAARDRPLPDDKLRIVVTGTKQDRAA